MSRRIEAPVQQAVGTLYAGIGCTVYQNSVFGTHPKGVTPGIPDLRVKHPIWRLDFDHEVKPPKKRQSEPQWRYMNEAWSMGQIVVLGGVEAAIGFLAFLKLGVPVGDTIHFKPRESWGEIIARRIDGDREELAAQWYESAAFEKAVAEHGYKPPVPKKRSYK